LFLQFYVLETFLVFQNNFPYGLNGFQNNIMKQTIHSFNQNNNLSQATGQLFEALKVPLKRVSDLPIPVSDILEGHHKKDFEDYTQESYFVGAIGGDSFNDMPMNPNIKWTACKDDFILVFALEISRLDVNKQKMLPTRHQLFELARAFSRAFPTQPVILVFRYEGKELFISVAICDQKKGGKNSKMSLLRDVNVEKPQEAHLRILQDLTIPRNGKNAVDSFETLYQYWLEKLNVSALNKKFYNELSNWYFWALKHVRFPNEPTDETQLKAHRANNVIRLITRLIFTWFLKEKKLVSEDVFDLNTLKDAIQFDASNLDDATYYRAVLQNLFFATLNQEVNKRRFRKATESNNKSIYHYANRFKNVRFAETLFDETPFLNGGLFECLDKEDLGEKGAIDGFSDDSKQQAHVPNFLFFKNAAEEDLNEIYGTKNKKYTVRGIICILKDYKFTIAENTPLEQEIALDPELLGHVFENLLASFNPETQITARKQTGSFYTPREIVHYMVDESLMAYLQNALQLPDNQSLRIFFGDTTEQPFDETTVSELIKAIDNCKMLDPACGSGAFPMGILNRMVRLLDKLDPKNHHWKALQLKKVESIDIDSVREAAIQAIETAFESNELNYARKLYLIQNCIYGVDIQPIAVQIAKLRCFISLLCDQKVNDLEDNRGVIPLPNLETKFIAANTLIGLEDMNLAKMAVEDLMAQRAALRHRVFSEKRHRFKRKLQEDDAQLRHQIKTKLDKLGMGGQVEQLATWNPFDQNTTAHFFDAKWMFNLDGFDLVIGNPPYGFRTVLTHEEKNYFRKTKKIEFSSGDSAELFCKICFNQLVKEAGLLTFIIPKKSIYGDAWEDLRVNYWKKYDLSFILDTGKSFENVLLEAAVFGLVKAQQGKKVSLGFLEAFGNIVRFADTDKSYIFLKNNTCQIYKVLYATTLFDTIQQKSYSTPKIKTQLGLGIGNDFFSETQTPHKLLKGIDIERYKVRSHRYLKNVDKLKWENVKSFLKPKIIAQRIVAHIEKPTPHLKITVCYDESGFAMTNTLIQLIPDKDILPKFLLAYLNSQFANWYIYNFIYAKAIRTMDFYDFYIQQMPIPKISMNFQNLFVQLADYLIFQKQTIELGVLIGNYFEQIIDGMVCELYFEAEMEAKQLNIIELVAADLAMLPDFTTQHEGVKRQMIEQLYQKWVAPTHEIKKRLDLMPVRSPDILGVILKG
jgi:adenine-specific DNA-methyltransferase